MMQHKARYVWKPCVLAFLLVLAVAAVHAQSANSSSKGKASKKTATATLQASAPVAAPDYIIGTEDVLAINVWKEPELTKTVPVRPDGKISLPLVGEVQAAGKTPKQLQEQLSTGLQSYIASPEVTVMVQEVRSQKINVVGEVNKPGTFILVKPMTVLDGLAEAGGFREFAKTSKIYVLRVNADGTQTRFPFNYKKVIKGRNSAENIQLESHDTIVVP
jgi:polysaccharide export outer membrane protein